MGKSNQQRRAAKAKQRHLRTTSSSPAAKPEPASVTEHLLAGWQQEQHKQSRRDEAYALLQRWSRAAARLGRGVEPLVEQDEATTSPEVLMIVEELLVDELAARLARAYEYGWEPRDLVHATRKDTRTNAYAVSLIGEQARATGAATRAPQRWRDQLSDLGPLPIQPWRPVRNAVGTTDRSRAWADLFGLVKALAELVPLEPIGPTPSHWGRRSTAASPASSATHDRILTRIRALLAKAEATEHPAEAETFTAKAQELMTRHAVDEAVLRSDEQEQIPVETRRVHLEPPYAGVKASLLASVARPNRCRTILLAPYDIAVLVGTPLDVDQSEMLFTSLLIQATRAMAEAGHHRAGSFDRSATFRRSFLLAYATRIGERLEEADRSTTATYGAALVPLLQREADAVTAEFERQFPHTRSVGSGYLDRRGWEAGRAAADRAALVAGQISA